MKRYLQLAHAIQSALAFQEQAGADKFTPKHLRVGIDITKADEGSIVRLLISKGVFTSEELEIALEDGLERELAIQTKEAIKLGCPPGVIFG